MSILTGLGGALGAAASGLLTGENKAEAVKHQRDQEALNNQLKQEQLASLKASRLASVKDPNAEKRKFWQGIAADFIKQRSNPELGSFFSDPANAEYAKHFDEATAEAIGLGNGDIPVDQAHPDLILLHGNLPQPKPEFTPPPLPTGAMGAYPVADKGVVPPTAGPPITPAVFRMLHPQQAAGGKGEVPAPAPPAAAPPKPKTPTLHDLRVRLSELASNPPDVSQAPAGMTPKQAQKWAAQQLSDWSKHVQALDAAIKSLPTSQAGEAKLPYVAPTAAARLGQIGASTGSLNATAAMNRALTPVREAQGRAATEKTKNEAKAVGPRLKLEERRTAAAEKNANTAAGRLEETKAYHKQVSDRAERVLQQRPDSSRAKAIQSRISTGLRIMTATKRSASGADMFIYPAERRDQAQRDVDAGLQEWDSLKASAGGGGVISQPAPKNTKEVLEHPLSQEEIGFVKTMKAQGPAAYKAWVAGQSANQQKRIRFAERQLPKR